MSFERDDPTVIRKLNGLLKGKPTVEIGLPVKIYEAAQSAKGETVGTPPVTIHPYHREVTGAVAAVPVAKGV